MKKSIHFMKIIAVATVLAVSATSCGSSDKEHTFSKTSVWEQTVDGSTHQFRLISHGSWIGEEGRKNAAEHEYGTCLYSQYTGDNTHSILGFDYMYERHGNNYTFKENVPYYDSQTATVWLEGYVDGDIMFLSNDTLTFELKKTMSVEKIK